MVLKPNTFFLHVGCSASARILIVISVCPSHFSAERKRKRESIGRPLPIHPRASAHRTHALRKSKCQVESSDANRVTVSLTLTSSRATPRFHQRAISKAGC